MNERIRELYQQAHDVEEQTLYLIVPTMLPEVPKQVSRKDEIRTFNPEKFAELIVRECSKISTELCNELKADESIQTPGSKTNWNLYMISLRNKLSESFEIGGVES